MLSTCLHLLTTLRHGERCRLCHLFKAACKPTQRRNGFACSVMPLAPARTRDVHGGGRLPVSPLLPPEFNQSCKNGQEALTGSGQGLNYLRLETFPKVAGPLASTGTRRQAHEAPSGHGAGRRRAAVLH